MQWLLFCKLQHTLLITGLYDKMKVELCSRCGENLSCILMRYGFWPASPVYPNLCLTMEVMYLIRSLKFECQISTMGFFDSFTWRYRTKQDIVSYFIF